MRGCEARPVGRKYGYGWALALMLAVGMAGAAHGQTETTSKPTSARSPLASVGDFILAQAKKEPEKPGKKKSAKQAAKPVAEKPVRTAKKKRKPEPIAQATAAASATEQAAKKTGAKANAKVEPKEKTAAVAPDKSQPGMPAGTPSYIHAKPAPITQALGPDIAKKIFSHAYTPVRQLALGRSAREIPGYECPNDPAAALTDIVPFPVKPATTSWVESYVVGCKPRTKRNFLVMLEEDKPQIAELLPGLTVTDPLLQRDAVTGARAFVDVLKPEGCEKMVFADTRLAEPLPGAGKPWVEVWTFNQCGTMGSVEMTFTPSPDGTKWAAKLVK
jgi:outer membrane biosynthesis protein TonB